MALPDETVYILVHSPLAGGLTWTLVAQEMLARGLNALVPHLSDQPGRNLVIPVHLCYNKLIRSY